ncbi:MAG: glycosyltransferase [Firmicutes bacterium]|nr:glycosyltransferase [Bacillota bacterium]
MTARVATQMEDGATAARRVTLGMVREMMVRGVGTVGVGPGASAGRTAGPPKEERRDFPASLTWEGDFASLHSFAHVNREMVLALLRKGVDVRIAPAPAPVPARVPAPALAPGRGPVPVPVPRPDGVGGSPALSWSRYRPIRDAMRVSEPGNRRWAQSARWAPRAGSKGTVHVRHVWPPDFRRPQGYERFVLILPWEYGYLPSAWIGPVTESADEVWAYSRYVRDCYVRSGVVPDKVAVVHPGVDPLLFHPQAPRVPVPATRGYRFLFVGGAATSRKGFDVLLRAYVRAFRRSDDVCLVVKDYFYGPVKGEIAAIQADPDAPEVVYVYGDADPWMMPGYYTACDCLVLPYRAEGFGLPALEAMACARPVIVTGHGAALDFCSSDVGYLIPAKEVAFPEMRVGDFPTCGPPVWAEPDEDALVRLLRHVFTHRDEAAEKGRAARARVLGRFTWDHAAAQVVHRLSG